ncbi:hypothetical protein EIN_307420 [Entamoeba invadens IP1]|uniref:Transmembrane protein n=1 Tax=Entamoeba invadens IP1 TaxID=370355 RepID=A0A0A1U4R8_ENTIV|nr:hypothetical protein EIN_307420 [Entamoeba invadens IP1]ELP86736.1 hypothetical protein EIN_307420 [Entamoeba invadens IP1]|eukprot:XP_004186082.1 hypothetical protein EIN_307420 [Entamoeba invadens IP1]
MNMSTEQPPLSYPPVESSNSSYQNGVPQYGTTPLLQQPHPTSSDYSQEVQQQLQNIEPEKKTKLSIKLLFFLGFIIPLIWPVIVVMCITKKSLEEKLWGYRALAAFAIYFGLGWFIGFCCVV